MFRVALVSSQVEPGSPHRWMESNFAVARCRRRNIRITILSVQSIDGVPVTDQQIQDWADEAERGYDVGQLRKRGRKPVGDGPGQVVPVRLDETLLAALASRAESDHVSRSELIRAAIRAYVA